MKINEMIAKLEAMSVNRELPIQVYDFTDTFQITGVTLLSQVTWSLPLTYELVTDSQTRRITVGEFIDAFARLTKILYDGDMVILLPDGTRYTLDGVEFDQRSQAYAISLGTKVLGKVLEKHIFVSFNDWEPLA